ncbi:MAG: hydroxymethylglutaryl-CoA lyase [Cellvibrionaceae bacterium]
MKKYPRSVKIVEVGPRDGLQNEKNTIDVQTKLLLIDNLISAGVNNIEAGSFVNSNWVPQMAGSDELLSAISKKYHANSAIHFTALTPNIKGVERAIASGVKEIAVFASATESFSKKNINCSINESLHRFHDATQIALEHDLKVRGYISCVVGCPYEGKVDFRTVQSLSEKLIEMGCYEISLGDTIGVATINDIHKLISVVTQSISTHQLALHLHDTYGQAIANVSAGLEMGISIFDSSIAGLGGCPYAKGASGNVATEDVIYLLDGLGIEHGINLEKLVTAGKSICDSLNKTYSVKSGSALLAKIHSTE